MKRLDETNTGLDKDSKHLKVEIAEGMEEDIGRAKRFGKRFVLMIKKNVRSFDVVAKLDRRFLPMKINGYRLWQLK